MKYHVKIELQGTFNLSRKLNRERLKEREEKLNNALQKFITQKFKRVTGEFEQRVIISPMK